MFGINTKLEELERDGNSIGIGIVGAGAMGMNLCGQTMMSLGMDVRIVVDIDTDKCIKVLQLSGVKDGNIAVCKTQDEAERARSSKKIVVTTDFNIFLGLSGIDVLVECTGNPEVGAKFCFDAIMSKKHVVTLSVETDVVLGHILKKFADNAGVTYTGIYGDEPGVIKELYDKVTALGFEVVAAGRGDTGNSDLKFNPETVKPLIEGRAQKRGFDPKVMPINPYMFASFNDGSKTSEELTMVANATGLVPDVRGCHGPIIEYANFQVDAPKLFSLKSEGGLLSRKGVVEMSGIPGGVGTIYCWVVITTKIEAAYQGLKYHGSGGPGPNWVWWEPIHWVGNTAPLSIAYAALYNQASIAPLPEKRYAETVTIAKQDLKVGDIIDEIGGFYSAGRIEKAGIARKENLLPFGLAKGSILKKDIKKGDPISYDDVQLKNPDSFVFQLRRLQDRFFIDV
jgi:predicted homoserine dehydrogenase-like protein